MSNVGILEMIKEYGAWGVLAVGVFLFLKNSEIIIRYPRKTKSPNYPNEVSK